jgi:hypothetical protein
MRVEILQPVSDAKEKTELKHPIRNEEMLKFLKKMDYFGYLPVQWFCPDHCSGKTFEIGLKKTILIIFIDLVIDGNFLTDDLKKLDCFVLRYFLLYL